MSLTSWAHSGLFTSDHKPHAIKERAPVSSESGASYALDCRRARDKIVNLRWTARPPIPPRSSRENLAAILRRCQPNPVGTPRGVSGIRPISATVFGFFVTGISGRGIGARRLVCRALRPRSPAIGSTGFAPWLLPRPAVP